MKNILLILLGLILLTGCGETYVDDDNSTAIDWETPSTLFGTYSIESFSFKKGISTFASSNSQISNFVGYYAIDPDYDIEYFNLDYTMNSTNYDLYSSTAFCADNVTLHPPLTLPDIDGQTMVVEGVTYSRIDGTEITFTMTLEKIDDDVDIGITPSFPDYRNIASLPDEFFSGKSATDAATEDSAVPVFPILQLIMCE